MLSFCNSPLWHLNYTWYSEYPRLTSCFETTVLAYIPLAVLVLFGFLPWPVGLRNTQHLHGKPHSWTMLGLFRYVASLLLTLTYAISFAYKLAAGASSVSSVTADLVHTITFALTLKAQEKNRKKGIGSSTLLFFFWLAAVVCRLPEFFRYMWEIFASDRDLPDVSELEIAVVAQCYILVCSQLLLSCWTDAEQDMKRPYLTAPPVSSLLFAWFSPMVLQKSRRPLQLEAIYNIPPDMKTQPNHSKWSELWNKELSSAGYIPGDGSCISGASPSMLRSLWKVYWKPVVFSCLLAILRAVVKIVLAPLLHFLIGYMVGNEPTWKGIAYALGIVSANFGSTLLAVHIDRRLSVTGLKVKTVMVAAIYRKILRLSSESQRCYGIGDLITLISVDADRIFRLSITAGYVVGGVPLIIISVVLLWQYLGGACLAGVAVMLVIMPLMALAVSLGNKYQTKQMRLKDKRLKTVAEMFSSVRVLKFFAWEKLFIDKCTSLRLDEMGLLKKYSYLNALSFFILKCSSSIVALVSFVTYLEISDNHILDPTTAFVSLTLFSLMQYPIFIIPDFISNVVQTSVSMMRIRKFLLSSEVDDCSVGHQLNVGDVVSVKNATLSWSKDETPVLNNITLTVKTGQLIAVVGPVGSGKSCLLSALLGNLRVCSGTVDCIESVAYAPQCPWIQNKTIRENVLFTSACAYDDELYRTILKVCCLEKDLDILPGGDLTEIGEKGINLSGGQKQRVSLARAAFQRKCLYLFDDPLSAVDAQVGASLFKDLIGPRGILKETTRILVTHNLSVLNEVSYIFVMQKGSIVESGTFEDLKQEGSVLSGLLKNFSSVAGGMNENREIFVDTSKEFELEKEKLNVTLVEKETMEEGSISPQIYRTYIRHSGSMLIVVILFYAIYRAVGVYMGIWLSEWSNDSVVPGGAQGISLRTYRIEVYSVLCISMAVANFIAVALLWKVVLSTSTNLHQLGLEGVMRAPLTFFDANPSGRLLNRFGKDVDEMDVQLPTAAQFTLDFLLLFVSSVILICIYIPTYIVIVIPVTIVLIVLRQTYVVPFRQMKRLETVTRSPVNHHFSETVAGLSSIRGYGVQRIFLRENGEKLDTMQNCTMNGLYFEYWIEIWMDVACEVLVVSMLLLVVTNRDKIDPGTTGLLVSYMLGAMSPIIYMIYYSTELEATLISAERLDEYRRLTPEAPWTSDFSPDPCWPWSGAVSFKSYSTRYRDELDLVLKSVHLDVHPGEKIGIVGRTGAGKSTLTLSLFRIIEAAAGKILVDDVDIATLGLHDLRSRITIIPQDPILFHGTLRFNLDPAGQHDTEDLWSALDKSHLGDVFREGDGLDFEIAEGGLNLSVGQRQLVCLARAVLRKTKILVLDEATASVDTKTDLLVQQTLRDVMSGCTVLTIAHRLHTVLASDRVVVMDQGRVVEIGSPSKLLDDQRSLFYAMALDAGVVFNCSEV